MQDLTALLSSLLAWCQAHPAEAIQIALLVWGVCNVLWAQLPRPKSATAQRVWDGLHAVLQLAVTHSSEPGTFKLPWLIRVLVQSQVLPTAPPPSAPVSPPPEHVTITRSPGQLTEKKEP